MKRGISQNRKTKLTSAKRKAKHINGSKVLAPLGSVSANTVIEDQCSYLVGIGASAGGLEALRALFSRLPRLKRISIVVVQHLAPQHRSRLVEIISHSTSLKVKEVIEAEKPEPNVIYITPPNSDIEFGNGLLHLMAPESSIGPKPSIDRFFSSLARELGNRSIGIILSGTGSDGSQGVRALKEVGGVTISQTIESSKYDGMPRSAKRTGAIDLELTPEEIARKIAYFDDLAVRSAGIETNVGPSIGITDPYQVILSNLEKATKVDFRRYKQSTIRRRIERRLHATHCKSFEEYASLIQNSPEEIKLLFQDVLISVTAFFRDEQAFRALIPYIEEKIRAKAPGQSYRAWVVGCATGEEAYSIAILILEAMEKLKKQIPIQIFATEIDEGAMTLARKGVYAVKNLSRIPTQLKEKYFERQDEGHYRVKDFVRDLIIFAKHDATQDPPFLKLDLVTCRNVLIYFTAPLQEYVLKTFHFSLDGQGVLFLGRSEATSAAKDLFIFSDKTARIFSRIQKKGDLPRLHPNQEVRRENLLASKDRDSTSTMELFHSMVSGFAPNSLLLNGDYFIRHIYGDANKLLNIPKGEATTSLIKLLPSDLSIEVSTLLRRAGKDHKVVRSNQRHVFKIDGQDSTFQISVVPITVFGKSEYVVCFNQVSGDEKGYHKIISNEHLPPKERARALEQELVATREHLQTIIEEHETANEELQALNEELQSANEELQSTNEELETTNEELQSANEELTTLNEEVNCKTSQYMALNQRYQAIEEAIVYPLVVLDNSQHIVDFNPAARFLLKITDSDIGQRFRSLSLPVQTEAIFEMIDKVLTDKRDGKIQLKTGERDFEIRTQLFRDGKGSVDGVVISFVENTEIVRALEQAKLHKERFSIILENTPALVSMKDSVGVYNYVNSRFCEVMGAQPDKIVGKTDEELFGQEVGGTLRTSDFEVLKNRSSLTIVQTIPVENRIRYWLSSKFPLLDHKRKAKSVCTISLDITDKIIREQQLEIFKKVVSASNAGIVVCESVNGDYRATLISNEFAIITESQVEKLLGFSIQEILARLTKNSPSVGTHQLLKAIESKESDSFLINLNERQGGDNWVELKISKMSIADSPIKYIVLMIFDVNERQKTQKLLQHQQEELSRFSKLAALGEVAAGISHEINTPLNVITTRTDLLRKIVKKGELKSEKILSSAAEIEDMVKSISNVIQGLKSLTRMESEELSCHNLISLTREATKICDFRVRKSGIKLEVVAPNEEILVKCFPVQIVQILINLINNSIDAITEFREPWIRVETWASDSKAFVRVTDCGKGIDANIAEKIMTPFFTTKKAQSGTGLGLSLSRNIARHHRGDLRLDSASNHTSFILELPLLKQ